MPKRNSLSCKLMPSVERRFEIRSDGNTLSGVAIRYGDTADIGGFYERFLPGACGDLSGKDIILNRQHRRDIALSRTGAGLTFADSETELSFRAELVNTSEASDVLELVRSRVMRGCSLEFHPLSERVLKAADGKPLVEIVKAEVVGLAVVDRAAYPESTIEARMAHVAALGKDHAGGAPSRAPQREFRGRRIFL